MCVRQLGRRERFAHCPRPAVNSERTTHRRERMGHAFSIPGADQRACYETVSRNLSLCGEVVPGDRRTYRLSGSVSR